MNNSISSILNWNMPRSLADKFLVDFVVSFFGIVFDQLFLGGEGVPNSINRTPQSSWKILNLGGGPNCSTKSSIDRTENSIYSCSISFVTQQIVTNSLFAALGYHCQQWSTLVASDPPPPRRGYTSEQVVLCTLSQHLDNRC